MIGRVILYESTMYTLSDAYKKVQLEEKLLIFTGNEQRKCIVDMNPES